MVSPSLRTLATFADSRSEGWKREVSASSQVQRWNSCCLNKMKNPSSPKLCTQQPVDTPSGKSLCEGKNRVLKKSLSLEISTSSSVMEFKSTCTFHTFKDFLAPKASVKQKHCADIIPQRASPDAQLLKFLLQELRPAQAVPTTYQGIFSLKCCFRCLLNNSLFLIDAVRNVYQTLS